MLGALFLPVTANLVTLSTAAQCAEQAASPHKLLGIICSKRPMSRQARACLERSFDLRCYGPGGLLSAEAYALRDRMGLKAAGEGERRPSGEEQLGFH